MVIRGEMTELNLSNSELIGDYEAKIVAEFIQSDETVQRVNLSKTAIGDEGAKCIAKAIAHNISVKEMSLDGAPILPDGFDALFRALRNQNVCIEELSILNDENDGTDTEFYAALEFYGRVRNKVLIPNMVKSAALSLIAARNSATSEEMGILATLPKEVVKMIAMRVWISRSNPVWIQSFPAGDLGGKEDDFVEEWILNPQNTEDRYCNYL